MPKMIGATPRNEIEDQGIKREQKVKLGLNVKLRL